MKLGQVILQKLDRFLVLRFYKVDGQGIDLGLCLGRAGKGRIAAQILVCNGFHCNHIESIAHAVAGDHCTGELGCLLDIVGGTGCDGVEDDFLCCAAAGQRCNLICHFFFGHQETFAFLDLHGITKRTAGTGNDRDLVYRCGVRLQSGDKGMTDFMIGNDLPLFFAQDLVFLFFSHLNQLDCFR